MSHLIITSDFSGCLKKCFWKLKRVFYLTRDKKWTSPYICMFARVNVYLCVYIIIQCICPIYDFIHSYIGCLSQRKTSCNRMMQIVCLCAEAVEGVFTWSRMWESERADVISCRRHRSTCCWEWKWVRLLAQQTCLLASRAHCFLLMLLLTCPLPASPHILHKRILHSGTSLTETFHLSAHHVTNCRVKINNNKKLVEEQYIVNTETALKREPGIN